MISLNTNSGNLKDFLHDIFWTGLKDGFKVSLSIAKLMIPASLIVKLLDYFGFIKVLSRLAAPVCSFLGLHGESILALISGYLAGTLPSIAVMTAFSLPSREIAILSAMIVLSHTLPVELAVQKKAGGPLMLIACIRLLSSLLTGFVLNRIIPADSGQSYMELNANTYGSSPTFYDTIISWLYGNSIIIKIVIINIVITILYRLLKRYSIIEKISRIFRYIMFILGLPGESAFLWIITNVLGLIFGSSMIIEAKGTKSFDEDSVKRLNISLATFHSIIQETSNFLPLGVPVVFLVFPRLIFSITTTWLYNIFLKLKGKK